MKEIKELIILIFMVIGFITMCYGSYCLHLDCVGKPYVWNMGWTYGTAQSWMITSVGAFMSLISLMLAKMKS